MEGLSEVERTLLTLYNLQRLPQSYLKHISIHPQFQLARKLNWCAGSSRQTSSTVTCGIKSVLLGAENDAEPVAACVWLLHLRDARGVPADPPSGWTKGGFTSDMYGQLFEMAYLDNTFRSQVCAHVLTHVRPVVSVDDQYSASFPFSVPFPRHQKNSTVRQRPECVGLAYCVWHKGVLVPRGSLLAGALLIWGVGRDRPGRKFSPFFSA